MFSVMMTGFCLYVVAVILFFRKVVLRFREKAQDEIFKAKEAYERLLKDKDAVAREKMMLSQKAVRIFTLYEITKEITKTLSEEKAWDVFRTKLSEEIVFSDCEWILKGSDKHRDLLNNPSYFIVEMKGQKQHLGYLAIRGLSEQDKDKVRILGHQFALALRRVKLYEAVEQIAITDSLTGVYTRRYFLERFEEELKRSEKRKIDLSFLMIDVDYFKNYNDQYGHLTGDRILSEIGKIIKESIREIDIAGRYGGEEFCVVLPDTDHDGARFAAERIRGAVEETLIKAYDVHVKVTVSIGISTYPLNGLSTVALIDKADWALYRAKKQGRNAICSFGIYE